MKSQREKSSKQENSDSQISRKLVVAAISATLRIFIPVFGLFLAGLAVDALRGTTASFAIIGTFIGFAVAAFLIYLQVKGLDTNLTKAVFETEEFDKQRAKKSKNSRKTTTGSKENRR